MEIRFTTNLDLAQNFVYDIRSQRVPNIGERIEIFV